MGKISGRKYVIRIFLEYVAVSRKSSKTVITRERRNEGMNPLEVFHTSLRSTHHQNMGPKGLKHLNMFPRQPQWLSLLRPKNYILREFCYPTNVNSFEPCHTNIQNSF
jgi:hypothetical protein